MNDPLWSKDMLRGLTCRCWEKLGTFHIMAHITQVSQKKRVIFDCSAEFEGRSINQELLSGPGLKNQVAGVLKCFKQE